MRIQNNLKRVTLNNLIKARCDNELVRLQYNHPIAGLEWEVIHTGKTCFGKIVELNGQKYCSKCHRISL